MNTEPQRGSASLDRGLALLKRLAADGGATPLRITAASLGLPLSTARRLAAALERQGLIVRIGHGRYSGGAGLAALARAVDERALLARLARPHLRALAREWGATTHLGVLEAGMVTYLVKERGSGADVVTREGLQLEAYCTAIGKMLLASLPEADREAYLADGPFVPLTARTIVNSEALRAELHSASERGYAMEDGEIVEGLGCLAVPIAPPNEPALAAISIARTGSSPTLDDHDLLKSLYSCATRISEHLT